MGQGSRKPSYVLVPVGGDHKGTSRVVGMDSVLVGRSMDASMRLGADGISRFHARLTRGQDGSVVVRDLDSSNGTFVNGKRITQDTTLSPGDRVRFGPEAVFELCCGIRRSTHETDEVDIGEFADGVIALLAARNQARLHLAEFEYEEAAVQLERVLEGLKESKVPAPEDVGEISIDLGRCRLEQGRLREATVHFEHAVSALETVTGSGRSLARARFMLGRALYSRDPQRAVSIVGAAAEELPFDDALSIEIEHWLASRVAPTPK